MAGVHLYGKSRVGVGYITAIWVTRTEMVHLAIVSIDAPLAKKPFNVNGSTTAFAWPSLWP